ncbi:MAG: S1C family serine protease [Roseburia sp.]|nr:S1C family serine protease [Roseburia sp.]
MEDQEKENFDFIREKIKEKPLNKKRMLKQGAFTLAMAVMFGMVACGVFTYMQPLMDGWMHPKEDTPITIPEDEIATETEVVEPEEETPTETVVTETTIIKKELELADYQALQNKIYAVGKEKNSFIVTVTGVVSDTDWYNNAYESMGQASGIIIGDNNKELLILTERKVIQEAGEISVTFINDVTLRAELKKYDGNTGLAMLSVSLEELDESTKNAISYAELGNSLSLAQGNVVIAVGSPLGTNYSIAAGNITSVSNEIHTVDNTYKVLTTDIVGSKNSSGALLNLSGEIVGLVMQDYSSIGDENTLTAVSISELKKLIEMLSNGKDIPYLGLKVVTATERISREYDIPQGVYIMEVILDSPGLWAGLQMGDVITEMDGEEITSVDAYETKVLSLKPGDSIDIAVKRQGMEEYTRVECTVTAGKLE